MQPKEVLDITTDLCPITLVKVLLALDSLSYGDILEVHLSEGGASKNVPRSLAGGGHKVHSMIEQNNGTYKLYVEKCSGDRDVE